MPEDKIKKNTWGGSRPNTGGVRPNSGGARSGSGRPAIPKEKMRKYTSVSIPPEVQAEVKKIMDAEGKARGQVVTELLKKQLNIE